jgi:thymidylate synthase (FAD)
MTDTGKKSLRWDDVKNDPNAVQLLDGGFIVLKSVYGEDRTVCDAARISYGDGTKNISDDRNLLRYLLRNKHTSPFEQCCATFIIRLPLFVMGQLVRHRTAKLNQMSGRYSEMPEDYYTPEKWRKQSTSNKQGGEEEMEYEPTTFVERTNDTNCMMETIIDACIEDSNGGVEPEEFSEYANDLITIRDNYPRISAEDVAQVEYHHRLDAGVSRELARTCLPQSQYTLCVWQCDLHNMMHFLKLRLDPHAQYEIRVYAQAMYELLKRKFPLSMEAFDDYVLHAMTFSRMELLALKDLLVDAPSIQDQAIEMDADRADFGMSKREKEEYRQKLIKILGMT